MVTMDTLAKSLESASVVRKRFRKDGSSWIREAGSASTRSSNPMQTTAALNLNAVILMKVVQRMPCAKIPVAVLEEQATHAVLKLLIPDPCMFTIPNLKHFIALPGEGAVREDSL